MSAPQILVTTLPPRSFDVGAAMRLAARARGISVLRLGAELLRREHGRQCLTAEEYFYFGAHQPGLSEAERGAFIGDSLGRRMCEALGTKGNLSVAGLFRDKLLCDLMLRSAGLAAAPIRAVAGPSRGRLPYPSLPDRAAVLRFLTQEAEMPIFGKPVFSSFSLGALSITGRPGPGRLSLGDGREVSAEVLADEIFRHFPEGYLFQEMLRPHPETVPLTGPVLATLRLVTLRAGGGISLLYGGIKWPGKGSMVDGVATLGSLEAIVDDATAEIRRLQDPYRLGGHGLEVNPVTGAPILGRTVPDWRKAVALAIAVHELFPGQRVLGGDYGLTPEGPMVVEINNRPGMSFFQKTAARGLWNPTFAPRLTEALAEAGHRRPTRALPLPWAA